jgi:hypothetical protein
VSGLWTPSGEHLPDPDPVPTAPLDADHDDQAAFDEGFEDELRRVRSEIAGTPAADIVANHAIGLWQLAVLHLNPEDGEPHLGEAAVAIDAMGAIVDALGDRLADNAAPLRDAVTQLRLAFVAVQREHGGSSG